MSYELSTHGRGLRWGIGVAAIAAGGLALAACGGGYSGSQKAANAGTPTTTMPTTPVTIALGPSRLGPVVVDAAGHTLYRFDKDIAGSGTSACNGACATMWPAALLNGQPTASPGLTGVLGAIARTDGTRQVTLDGHPLYSYSGDKAAGDTAGDGFGGIWHVVHTSGTANANSTSVTTNGY